MYKIISVVVMMLCGLSFSVFAAEDKDFAGCTGDQVIIGTGLPSAPYSQMMQVPMKMAPELMCEYRGGTGGSDNIQALVERKIDAGLVQPDVLDFMKRTEPMVGKKIRSLMALHSNYLHFFVLKNGFSEDRGTFKRKQQVVIKSDKDLQNRTIAAFGSGPITGMIINERLGYGMKIIEVAKKEEGIAMLKSGKVAAFFAMGGKPIPWVDKEINGNEITLANFEPASIQKLGQPYYAGKLTYKKLGVVGVNAVSLRNELVVWDFTGQRAQQLLKVRKFFKDNLNDIKDSRGAHPAWQDVESDTLEDVSWQRFQPAGSAPVKSAKKKK